MVRQHVHVLNHGRYFFDYNAQPQIQFMQKYTVSELVVMSSVMNAHNNQQIQVSPMVTYKGTP